jgi:hypothetical protein
MDAIVLEVRHPDREPGPIEGFRFFWAYYVSGYRSDRHCQTCFRGAPVPEFSTRTVRSGLVHRFDRISRFPYLYICGVASGPRSQLASKNLHFPLQYEVGAVAEIETYNGYQLRAEHAVTLPIPELPEGWQGKSREHTRCKNYRFAVDRFGPSAGG